MIRHLLAQLPEAVGGIGMGILFLIIFAWLYGMWAVDLRGMGL